MDLLLFLKALASRRDFRAARRARLSAFVSTEASFASVAESSSVPQLPADLPFPFPWLDDIWLTSTGTLAESADRKPSFEHEALAGGENASISASGVGSKDNVVPLENREYNPLRAVSLLAVARSESLRGPVCAVELLFPTSTIGDGVGELLLVIAGGVGDRDGIKIADAVDAKILITACQW